MLESITPSEVVATCTEVASELYDGEEEYRKARESIFGSFQNVYRDEKTQVFSYIDEYFIINRDGSRTLYRKKDLLRKNYIHDIPK